MRVLIACRFMEGFWKSIKNEKWEPTGVPALYKLMETLACEKQQLRIVFLSKPFHICEQLTRKIKKNYNKNEIEGINASFEVFKTGPKWFQVFGRKRTYLTDFCQFLKLLWICLRFKPDVIYFDKSNILLAALFARFTSYPVVLRMLGVTPEMLEIIEVKRPLFYLLRWCYRSPFKQVICTKDGSPGGYWLSKMLRADVPRQVFINGVKEISACEREVKYPIQILFLGRLAKSKRCDVFIEAILELPEYVTEKIQVHVIGDGEMFHLLDSRVQKARKQNLIQFHGEISHENIQYYFHISDIYVSLNACGNLSNANLEAYKAGLCCIIPEPNYQDMVDLETEEVVPRDCVYRLEQNELKDQLKKALVDFVNFPSKIEKYKQNIRFLSDALPTWESRINKEIRLISELKQ